MQDGKYNRQLTETELNQFVRYYHESGNSADSAPFFELARSCAELLKSSSSENDQGYLKEVEATLAEIHHNLGCVGTETNDPEGTLKNFEAFKNIVLEEAQVSSAPATLRVSIAWNELGNAWMLNKDWKKGEECFLESIRTAKEVPDHDRTDMSFPMVNLGLARWFAGRVDEAAEVIQEGLTDRRNRFGENDKDSFM